MNRKLIKLKDHFFCFFISQEKSTLFYLNGEKTIYDWQTTQWDIFILRLLNLEFGVLVSRVNAVDRIFTEAVVTTVEMLRSDNVNCLAGAVWCSACVHPSGARHEKDPRRSSCERRRRRARSSRVRCVCDNRFRQVEKTSPPTDKSDNRGAAAAAGWMVYM